MLTINLGVRGLGHVPSFKNNKMIARGRIITNPKRQKWMESCIQSFVSQLRSSARTIGAETLTEQQRLSLIVSSLPEDDSRQWIPKLTVKAIDAEVGREGAMICIENDTDCGAAIDPLTNSC